MTNKILRIIPLIGVFILGLFAASQFVFNMPVEPHRWLVTILVTAGLWVVSDDKD
jgi:hypothetical protein